MTLLSGSCARVCVVAALLTGLGVPPTHAAADLSNGGFEQSAAGELPSGWQVGKHYGRVSPGATFAVDATTAHEGGQSLKITCADGKTPAIFMTQLVDVEAGASYRLTVQIKGQAQATALRMLVVPNNFKHIATAGITVGAQWQRYELNFQAPTADVRPVSVRFDVMEPGVAWIDDVTFVKVSAGTGAMSAAEAFAPPTRIADGGFESTSVGALPPGWQIGKHYGRVPTGATFAVDDRVAHEGGQSIKITSPSDEGIPAILMSNAVAIEPGQTYVITAYLKSAAKYGEAGILALRSDYKGAERSSIVLTDQWRRYRLVFQAADKASGYFARFDARPGTIWIDDVTLVKLADAEKTSPALGYRYGDTAGEPQVTLTVREPTGATLANINGVCYAHGFGLKEFPAKWADVNLKVVRLHNVLSHLKILQKKPEGGFDYDFTLLDRNLDQILASGAVPQMSLCFVPVEMVDQPDPKLIQNNRYYLGQPSDYGQWEEYVFHVVKHCSERYPKVADWYWVFGNEPGVRQFSMGTHEEYYTLYKHTLAGALRANDQIRIGAGSFAHFDWLKDFVERCAAEQTRVDLITWHHYNIVPEDYTFLIDKVRKLLAPYREYADVTLAIDEWNPILPDNRPAYYSAGNYGAAHAVASIHYMMKAGLDYQTHFIASSPHGWGMTGFKGVKQPTFNAFQMLGMLGAEELGFAVPADEPYVGGLAARRGDGAITVMVWYVKSRNDLTPDFAKSVTVRLPGISSSAKVTHYLVDDQHSNSQTNPQREGLESVPATLRPSASGSGSEIQFTSAPNSVSLFVIVPR
jgi:hypothetical protein